MSNVNITIFKEKNGEEVLGIGFMPCPICGNFVFLTTGWEYHFCDKCRHNKTKPKIVYRLHENKKSHFGFDRVDAIEVESFNKAFLISLSLEHYKGGEE
jgi:hypothetical protein